MRLGTLNIIIILVWVLTIAGCENLQTRIEITEDGNCEINTVRKVEAHCNGSTVATGEIVLSQESIQAGIEKID